MDEKLLLASRGRKHPTTQKRFSQVCKLRTGLLEPSRPKKLYDILVFPAKRQDDVLLLFCGKDPFDLGRNFGASLSPEASQNRKTL